MKERSPQDTFSWPALICLTLALPEASTCRAAIRVAQSVVADIGKEAAGRSSGLVELSKCRENNSERDVTRIAKRYRLRLPVPLTVLEKTRGVRYTGDFRVISLRSWAQCIVDHNLWYSVVGLNAPDPTREKAILREFWKLFREGNPSHDIWQVIDEKSIDVGVLCPFLLHGDEGRGRKRAPFLICAYHSMIGKGTDAANLARTKQPYKRMRLNYSGSTFTHRLVSAVFPKMLKDEVALEELLRFLAEDSLSMLRDGVLSVHGGRYHMAVLHTVGDWAFLAKCGKLTRSYSNVQKRPLGRNSVPKGICHYCHAGKIGFPFEDFGPSPAWKRTKFLADDEPFYQRPQLLRLPHDRSKPAAFFTFDVWHAYHLGTAKVFIASCFAMISDLMPGGSIDDRFSELTRQFLEWCDESRASPFVHSITKDSIGWPDRNTFPNGQWSKGHISTMFHKFLRSWFESNENSISDHQLLCLCKEANCCINQAFEELYASDLWLEPSDARRIAEKGLRFLWLFMKLARKSFDQGRALFPFMPKSHVVYHIFDDLKLASTAQSKVINPMAFGVQVDEGYVGKLSRLSRRVSPVQVIHRVLERSLWAARKHWVKAGYWQA